MGIFPNSQLYFYYNKNSVAEKDILKISETQEKAYFKITEKLGLEKHKEKINYFLYNTEEEKTEFMGDDGFAQAIWHDFSIHIIYTENIKPIGEHEDTHLLTLSWGVATGFFQEGLAEYMSGCIWKNENGEKKSAEDFIKKAYKEKLNNSIENFFSHFFWNETIEGKWGYYYPLAGVFTKFLIEKFGLEKYREFYKSINRKNSSKEIIEKFETFFGNFNDNKNIFENNFK